MAEVTVKVQTEVDVDAICDVCGTHLDTSTSRRDNELIVEPCERCLENAKDEGRKEAEANG